MPLHLGTDQHVRVGSAFGGAGTVLVTSTFLSTYTNADGSVGTSTGVTTSASVVPLQASSSGSSSTGKTWGIVGGVVGGVVLVSALVFLAYRLTRRRFASLDDGDEMDEIKWPDLLPDGQEISAATTTLMPLQTHRTGGAGVGDDDDQDGGGMRYSDGDLSGLRGSGEGFAFGPAGPGAAYAPLSNPHRTSSSSTANLLSHAPNASPPTQYPDPYASYTYGGGGGGPDTHSRSASREQLAMIDGGAAAFARGYDPYFAPAAQAQGMVHPPSSPPLGGPGPRGAPGAGGAVGASPAQRAAGGLSPVQSQSSSPASPTSPRFASGRGSQERHTRAAANPFVLPELDLDSAARGVAAEDSHESPSGASGRTSGPL